MDSRYQWLVEHFDAKTIDKVELIQTLWSGYGELTRVKLSGGQLTQPSSVIVKYVDLSSQGEHLRGWNTALSHQRKLNSYHVEANWYQMFSRYRDEDCHWPKGLYTAQTEDAFYIVMEDLSEQGFTETTNVATSEHLEACLSWLAHFHAKFINTEPSGLWETGTYWHLNTRPDELENLEDQTLKALAHKIDLTLSQSPYQTLVHGDAKLANFCFKPEGKQASAVDFQYVGRGCAMKDVALFMSSAVLPEDCAAKEKWVLDTYFRFLRVALAKYHPDIDSQDVEQAWRPLFGLAWADFQRFVKGWKPDHWKINQYTESLTSKALEELR